MKTIIHILIIAFFISNLQAQTTAIPDPAFEQKLIAEGIDSDGVVNGRILNSDAQSVTHLYLMQSNISSLVGIEAFVNLTHILCYSNNLTSIDFSANIALQNVSCYDNHLVSLDVSTNTSLYNLEFHTNYLTSLDISNNRALTRLDCGANNLTSLDVSANTALISLSCGGNNLTTLDVSNNTALKYLSCSENNLTNLDVSVNTALESLSCGNNNLTSLDVGTNTALKTLFCGYNHLTNLNTSSNVYLKNLYCYNNNLENLNISTNTALRELNCQNNLPYLKICVPNLQNAIYNTNLGYWLKDSAAIYQENCLSLAITGQIAIDMNSNCLVDSLEYGLLGLLVKFERISDGAIFYFVTNDSLGNYTAYLDTGIYTATVITNNPSWQICPNSQQVTVNSNYNVQVVNWALQPIVFCPFLEVDISAPFLRMTGGGSNYTVSYCNNGAIAAANAYIEVDLDDDLNFISSTIPVASQNGTIYTFNLGNIEVGECGDFLITVLVDTSALFQQTHCTEAHIYPDSICVPIWANAIVDGHVGCQNDTVYFYIENLGAAMLLPQPYSIIEDNIAMHTGSIQLGAGQSITIAQAAAPGRTYRIEVQQLPGFPALLGDSSFTAAIEDCNPLPNGSFNTGFITQFSNGHSSPFIAVDCQQNRASYDPNDKSAQPEGYGLAHYIERGAALDYRIRFQNTGTDTAFNIVIMDTLSPYLDITSVQMGVSSHDYTWSIENGNVLKVNFWNIMLVDSNANEPLSHGFFRYRIEQKPNNPIGTVINNQAAIYFDYNPAVMTNTTFHTIGENFVLTVYVGKMYDEFVQVTAFPNPFTQATIIQIEGNGYAELQLSVFDLAGRAVVQKQGFSNNKIELEKGNLQTGMYLYQLHGNGKLIGVGKIVVQ